MKKSKKLIIVISIVITLVVAIAITLIIANKTHDDESDFETAEIQIEEEPFMEDQYTSMQKIYIYMEEIMDQEEVRKVVYELDKEAIINTIDNESYKISTSNSDEYITYDIQDGQAINFTYRDGDSYITTASGFVYIHFNGYTTSEFETKDAAVIDHLQIIK